MMFMGNKPFQTNDTFIAPSASVIGNVTNWDESSVWYGAVVRADSHPITIGAYSNVQDRAVVTTLSPRVKQLKSGFPPTCHIGHYVSVGAGSVLTSCRVEDLVVIGEKCIIGEGAVVESNVILEPGTVVPAYCKIPSGERWAGNPAQFVEKLDEEALDHIKHKAEKTAILAQEHIVEFLPIGNTYVHLEELEAKGVKATQG
jgi:carbonic anhydrase/acetyltransferase-like protein (isoleucine patch superfamily)